MGRSVALDVLPLECRTGLVGLGQDIRRARIRRGLTMKDLATRCMMTVPTVRKVERGDPSVSLGALMAMLWVLGLQGRLSRLVERDEIGEALEERRRPTRVRAAKDAF